MGLYDRIRQKMTAMRCLFRRGPSWLWRKVPPEKEYVSPTVMIAWWSYGLLSRIFTPQGWMMFWVWLAVGFYASIMTRSPVVIFFFILTWLFIFNLLFQLLFFPRLKIRRILPENVTPGSVFKAEYVIENRSFLPCPAVVPDSMLKMKYLRTDQPPCVTIPAKGCIRLSRRFIAERRGIFDFPSATAESAFPFGLLKISRCDGKIVPVICRPFSRKMRLIRLPEGPGRRTRSREHLANSGAGMDFHSCREYVYGDEPRKIHWGASARFGRLVVKEFKEEKLSRAAVILDTALPVNRYEIFAMLRRVLTLQPMISHENERRLDAAISLAASFAVTLSSEDFLLDFFAAGKEIRHLRVGQRMMRPDGFLDELAAMTPERSLKRFENITPAMLTQIGEAGTVFVVLLNRDPAAEEFCRKVRKTGAAVRILFIGHSGDHGLRSKEETSSLASEILDPESILTGERDEI